MSFWDNLKKLTQPYAEDEYDEYDEELDGYETEEPAAEEPAETPRRARRSPFASSRAAETESAPAAYSSSSYTAADTSSSFNGQVINMSDRKQDVVLFHAKSFDDAAKAADELRKRRAVILNMENVDKSLTRRVVDFLSGAVYALDGSVRKIAQSTYLFCPHNMNVMGDLENLQRETADSYI